LLVGGELELFGQFLGALGGIGRAAAPTTVVVRGRGLLIVDGLSWAPTKGVAIEISPVAMSTSRDFLSMEISFSKRSVCIYEWNYESEVAQENRIGTIFA